MFYFTLVFFSFPPLHYESSTNHYFLPTDCHERTAWGIRPAIVLFYTSPSFTASPRARPGEPEIALPHLEGPSCGAKSAATTWCLVSHPPPPSRSPVVSAPQRRPGAEEARGRTAPSAVPHYLVSLQFSSPAGPAPPPSVQTCLMPNLRICQPF